MKHLIKTSLLLLAMCMPLSVIAYDFVADGIYYKTDLWGDYAMVCDQGEDGGLYRGDVTIPEAVTNDGTRYPVLKIGAYAFNNCTELTSVNMPASINEIGDHAFENCSALSNVTIPYAVTLIGPSAFKDCASITQINIPARVTEVKIWAFENCRHSTEQEFRYSAWFMLLTHTAGNIRSLLGDEAFEAWLGTLRPEIHADLEASRAYWRDLRWPWLAQLQNRVYNVFLRSNRIADGTKNYGQALRLVLTLSDLHDHETDGQE